MSHMSRALAWAPVRLARKRQRRPPGLDTSVLADYDAIHSTKWARRAAFRWGATMLGRTWIAPRNALEEAAALLWQLAS